nr:MAG TPA: hypothetical protein [Caudoviricetes sp.]
MDTRADRCNGIHKDYRIRVWKLEERIGERTIRHDGFNRRILAERR